MATIDTDVNTSISFEVTASPFSFRCYFKNYILGARKPSYHQKMVMFSMVSAFYFSCVSFLQLLNEVKAMKFYFLHEIQLQASLIWLTLNIFWFFNFLMNRYYFETRSIPFSTSCHIFLIVIIFWLGREWEKPHVLLNLDHKVSLK